MKIRDCPISRYTMLLKQRKPKVDPTPGPRCPRELDESNQCKEATSRKSRTRSAASVVRWRTWWSMALLFLALLASPSVAESDFERGIRLTTMSPPSYPSASANESMYLPKNRVCQSIDIRNKVHELAKLRGCRVIEGNLQILLMPEDTKPEDYLPYSFPELVEITDYLLFYRVVGLQDIGRLFPNLTVIRGNYLMVNYALAIFENSQLEQIGLVSLTSIQRGLVRIENNQKLCFSDTIGWEIIAGEGDHVLKSNKEKNECPVCERNCPSKQSDPNERLCWNRDHCQKVCPGNCNSGGACMANGECCHELCLGGCTGPTASDCKSCREIVVNDTICVHECPPDTFEFMGRRCITERECRMMHRPKYKNDLDRYPYKPFGNKCIDLCPSGYMEVNRTNQKTCELCKEQCLKECSGKVIDNLATAQQLRGCTYIRGSLEISIREGQNVARELEMNLRDIIVINGYLKIFRTGPIISLNFFKNLTEIRGKSSDGYSLIVLDNQNLQELWDWKKRNLTIGGGDKNSKTKVLFHYNPKLCYEVIETFRKKTGLDKFSEAEVSQATNGDKVACNLTHIDTQVSAIVSGTVLIKWIPFRHHDMRTVLGYVINYKEAPFRNVSMFEDRDACGGDGWTAVDVGIGAHHDKYYSYEVKDFNEEKKKSKDDDPYEEKILITSLKPFTQYVYYIKTYTISSERSGGLSQLIYFKTAPAQPSSPRYLNVYPTSIDTLVISWMAPLHLNGEIEYYKIKGEIEAYDNTLLQNRNYCDEPMLPMSHSAMIEMVEEKKKNAEMEITLAKKNEEEKEEECSCIKPNKPIESVDESMIYSAIAFEDTLHNTVYIKRGPDSNRRKRNIFERELIEDRQIQSSLFFEDALQNRAYVPENSKILYNGDVSMNQFAIEWDKIMKMGYVLKAFKDEDDNLVYKLTSKIQNRVKRNTEMSTLNQSIYTYLDADSMPEDVVEQNTFTKFERYVPPTNLSYVMHNLRHFGKYKISVTACVKNISSDDEFAHLYTDVNGNNRASYCSRDAQRSEQTLRKEKADDIPKDSVRYTKIASNDSSPSIKLQWEEPSDPNGIIITYQIEYKRVDLSNHKPQIICLTGLEFSENDKSYVLGKLLPGNYSIRVRATSIAGDGAYTEALYFDIPESNLSMPFWKLMIIFFVCLCFVSAIFCLMYFFKQKYLETEAQNMRLIATVNPEYVSPHVYKPDQWELPRKKIQLLKELGNGSFGMVYEGIAKDIIKGTSEIRCAVKTVNENATLKERDDFLNEASVMKAFNTHHVVRLLGVVSIGQPTLVIMELMGKGDLKTYLRSHRPENCESNNENDDEKKKAPTLNRILQMAVEIADGMAYLAAKKFVHRDLAARNCMVADDLTVKIGDFGMTRDIYETDYYRKGTKGLMPVRWMAPESLRDGLFASSSDVWSYGVVLWEMVTLASQPYQGLSNDQVLRYVIDGGVMERPDMCPDSLYSLMYQTWNYSEAKRPTFLDIIKFLLTEIDSETFQKVSFYHSPEGIEARNQIMQSHPNDNTDMLEDLREEEEEDETEEGQEDSPLRDDFGDDFSSFEPTTGIKNGSSIHYNIENFSNSPKKTFRITDLNSSKVPLKAGYDDFDGISAGSLASSKDTLNLPLPENSVKSVKNSPFAQKKSSSKGNISQSSIGRPSLSPQSPSIFGSSGKPGSRASPSVGSMGRLDPEYENRSPISLASQTPEAVSYRVNCLDSNDSESVVVILDESSKSTPPRTPSHADSNNTSATITATGSNKQLYSSKISGESQRAQSPALNNGYIGGAAAT